MICSWIYKKINCCLWHWSFLRIIFFQKNFACNHSCFAWVAIFFGDALWHRTQTLHLNIVWPPIFFYADDDFGSSVGYLPVCASNLWTGFPAVRNKREGGWPTDDAKRHHKDTAWWILHVPRRLFHAEPELVVWTKIFHFCWCHEGIHLRNQIIYNKNLWWAFRLLHARTLASLRLFACSPTPFLVAFSFFAASVRSSGMDNSKR